MELRSLRPKWGASPPDPPNPGIQSHVLFGDLEIRSSEILRCLMAASFKWRQQRQSSCCCQGWVICCKRTACHFNKCCLGPRFELYCRRLALMNQVAWSELFFKQVSTVLFEEGATAFSQATICPTTMSWNTVPSMISGITDAGVSNKGLYYKFSKIFF